MPSLNDFKDTGNAEKFKKGDTIGRLPTDYYEEVYEYFIKMGEGKKKRLNGIPGNDKVAVYIETHPEVQDRCEYNRVFYAPFINGGIKKFRRKNSDAIIRKIVLEDNAVIKQWKIKTQRQIVNHNKDDMYNLSEDKGLNGIYSRDIKVTREGENLATTYTVKVYDKPYKINMPENLEAIKIKIKQLVTPSTDAEIRALFEGEAEDSNLQTADEEVTEISGEETPLATDRVAADGVAESVPTNKSDVPVEVESEDDVIQIED